MKFFICLLLLISCSSSPEKLPTEKQLEHTQSDPIPAAYQLLYDSPGLPKPSIELQRVRILIWLMKMDLKPAQLDRLKSLRNEVISRQQSIEERELKISKELTEKEKPIYNAIWDTLKEGKTIEDAAEYTDQLQEIRSNDTRQKDMLSTRIEEIRSIFSAQHDFMRTLTPKQEKILPDALFFLRHHLDPIANPKDFSTLIGTTYEPGQYAVLVRGTNEIARETMNIGGLWTDDGELTGQTLHEARREAILYLILLEPALEEAVRVALELR